MNQFISDQLGARIWSEEEDRRLIAIIRAKEPRYPRWNEVAIEHGEGRSSKSCRLRWENQLKPDINHEPFESAEDEIVLEMQGAMGNKWAKIARALSKRKKALNTESAAHQQAPYRRTDNHVKNRWHAVLKKGHGCGAGKRKAGNDLSLPAKPAVRMRTRQVQRGPHCLTSPSPCEDPDNLSDGTRKSDVGHGICPASIQQTTKSAKKPDCKDHTSPCLFPLDDGIFSEDHLLPDPPQPADLEDLAVEFPSRSGLPSVSLPYLLGSSSNADNFCDFFLPEMPCLHFHCADPAAFSPHFDGSFELCMADRILEPNF